MKIETKFKVGDLTARKFDKLPNGFKILEVMTIITETCCSGTQVFYLCRAILAEKKYDGGIGSPSWIVRHAINEEQNVLAWSKYREDELIEAQKEHIDIITKN